MHQAYVFIYFEVPIFEEVLLFYILISLMQS